MAGSENPNQKQLYNKYYTTPTAAAPVAPVTPVVAPTIPSSFTTPDINSAFIKGWKPSGNQYLDYNDLTTTYGLPSDWVTSNYPTIQSSYDTWIKAQPAPEPGVFDPVIANPDKYASTSTSGVPDDVATALKNYLAQATGSLGGYQSTLNSLLSPSNFTAAYKPAYEQMVQKTMNDLSSKGMLNSTVAKDALAKTGDNVTSQYLQQLLSIASQFGSAANLPTSIAGALSQSKSTNPTTGWQFVKDLFDQTMA